MPSEGRVGSGLAVPESGSTLVETAPAKVNLTLHVVGRRLDGYHLLESLVAFAGVADELSLVPASELTLTVEGPTAAAAGPPDQNLVIRAVAALAERRPGLSTGAFRLVKRLPAQAGIGGGSSDAAAALRLVARLNGLALDNPDLLAAAAATGADVPVCLQPAARMMRGAGERVGPPLRLPPVFAVLVNPGVPAATRDVFKALAVEPGRDLAGTPHPAVIGGCGPEDLIDLLARARNDLERPALGIAPEIGTALARLRATSGCRLARMSGSGSTVFGLYDDPEAAAEAAQRVEADEPSWWVRSTSLR